MKSREKQQARELRKKGWSINDIYPRVGVSKGSVSVWVRDIQLNNEQKQELSAKGHTKEAVEKRREARLTNEAAKRQKIINQSKKEISLLSQKELKLVGIALYWAEGSKTRRGIAELSNSDPKMIKVMMRFFLEICKVPENKFRGHIHLHPHLDHRKAELYWSKISGISKKQFFKTTQQSNRASRNKKDSLPYGTFAIYVCDTMLFLKIKGWTEGIYEQSLRRI